MESIKNTLWFLKKMKELLDGPKNVNGSLTGSRPEMKMYMDNLTIIFDIVYLLVNQLD